MIQNCCLRFRTLRSGSIAWHACGFRHSLKPQAHVPRPKQVPQLKIATVGDFKEAALILGTKPIRLFYDVSVLMRLTHIMEVP